MHFLAQLAAKLIFCVGLMITVVSCVLGSVAGSGAALPFVGIAFMTVGAVLWSKASTKVCPGCAERVKSQTRKCQYCGADLVG